MKTQFKEAFKAEIKAAGEIRFNQSSIESKYSEMANKSQIRRFIKEMVDAGEICKRSIKKFENGRYSTYVFFS